MIDHMKLDYRSIVLRPFYGILFLLTAVSSLLLLAGPYYRYAFLPIVLVLFLFLIGRAPSIGYYLIIFLIPFSAYRQVSEEAEWLNIVWVLGMLVIAIVFFKIIIERKLLSLLSSNLWRLLFLFLAVCLISALLSPYKETAFRQLAQLLAVYSLFALSLYLITETGFSKILITALLASNFLSCSVVVIGYLLDIPALLRPEQFGAVRRATGVSTDPNFLASMITFTIPLLFYVFFTHKKTWIKFSAIIMLLVNVAAVILTHSRAGAVVLAATFFLILLEYIKLVKPRHLGFISALLIISILIASYAIPDTYWLRLSNTADSSFSERKALISTSWDLFKSNPILGTGLHTFQDFYADTSYAANFHWNSGKFRKTAHNGYLEILTGTGIIGLTVFLILLWRTIKNFNLAERQFLEKKRVDMISLVRSYRLSFVLLLIYFAFLSATFHKYFWLSLALSQIALRVSTSDGQEKKVS